MLFRSVIRILNAEPEGYSSEARKILNGLGELQEEFCTRLRLLELIPEYDVLIVRLGHSIDQELIDQGRRLRAIVSATTGLNHIDLEYADRMNIEVLSLKGEREFLDKVTATAELCWALLLNLVRHINQAANHVNKGLWDRDQFRGMQLQDKTLGVIGFGRLGSIVAEYGRAFRMKVLTCDPNVVVVPAWVEKLELAELLSESDVVTLHVNLNEGTSGMINREAFKRIKDGAIFINTSRGELVDESAMLEALTECRLSGVALDVLDGEAEKPYPWPIGNPVWQYSQDHDNVLLVPHLGGATIESMKSAELFMAKKLMSYLSNGS